MAAHRSLTDSYGKYTGKLGSLDEVTNNVPYVEAQIHGGVSVKDIDKVYIYTYIDTWSGRKSFNIDPIKLRKLESALKKNNIPYEVVR